MTSHFNPLAPRGARPITLSWSGLSVLFQSTRPSRGETPVKLRKTASQKISIHSPLAGRDDVDLNTVAEHKDFNPLAPRGARHEYRAHLHPPNAISIHSPLAGRDDDNSPLGVSMYAFQSTRPSRGETRKSTAAAETQNAFQSTRPSRGETTRRS